MSFFSNDMRVANTASSSFQSQANVGQFGWTGADQGHYNQLLQYVDECRKIWLNLEEKVLYIDKLLLDIGNIDTQVKQVHEDVEVAKSIRQEVVTIGNLIEVRYAELKPLSDQFQIDYADFSKKFVLINQMYEETEQAAIAAAQSEIGAKEWYDKSAEIAEELRKGNVYRGTWNPNTSVYPAHGGTNSTWDVVLNPGQLEHTWGGITWFWGDRLIYLKDSDAYQQVESGGSVTSVNNKKGAVVLTAADVGAIDIANSEAGTGNVMRVGGARDVAITADLATKFSNTFLPTPNQIGAVNISDTEAGGVIYSKSNKPTAAEVGALPVTGVEAGFGSLMRVGGARDTGLTQDIASKVPLVGSSTIAGSLTVRDGVAITNVGNAITTPSGVLKTIGGTILSLDGSDLTFMTAPLGSYVCHNTYYNGFWKKYDDSKASHLLTVDVNGLNLYASDANNSIVTQHALNVITSKVITTSPVWYPVPTVLRFMDNRDLWAAVSGSRDITNLDYDILKKYQFHVKLAISAPSLTIYDHTYSFTVDEPVSTNSSAYHEYTHTFKCHATPHTKATLFIQQTPYNENSGMPYWELRFSDGMDIGNAADRTATLTISAMKIW